MEAIKTTTRIHPLMAAAAASVIVVCAAGTAAITGILPSSHSAPEPQAMPAVSPYGAAPAAYTAPTQTAYGMSATPAMQAQQPMVAQAAPVLVPANATYVQPAPAVQQVAPAVEQRAPVVHKAAPKRVVHHYTQEARYDHPTYAQQPAPAPRQPNYMAIGTGAVIGGLVGNQIGSGNGRKLATVAGIIGGGMLGNEVANRNQQ
ncbi:glycine zipper 2TM domain-containing protein [Massilia agilis]|uniref:glycine zipper 2TM domain-containing protein n=1 Tax=Massilia agilis TaxID=1811226 RepID=UPI0027D9691B|nr:glycine zipper 2TM domain-containing protein [Massilia agilis]